MERITIEQWKHIPTGTKVWNGYPGGYCTVPKEPGFYTLYQLVTTHNTHGGWEWEKEN